MKILITGSRFILDKDIIFKELDDIYRKYGIESIIHGGARGVDTIAGEWAKKNDILVQIFKANWNEYGNAAGPIRNIQMLDEKPDLVVAFPKGISRGTRHCIKHARKRNIHIEVIEI